MGSVPVMLAGGGEAPLASLTFGAFAMIRVLSTRNNDPACGLDVIPPGGRDCQASHLLCNAFGFGGINASLALSAVQV